MNPAAATLAPSGQTPRMPAPAARQRLPLVGLFVANAISIMGNVFAIIAIPWFVLETTGSPTLTGLAAAMNGLPYIVGGVLGGAFVDRVGFRAASIISDLASAVGVAVIPLLHTLDLLTFPLLLVFIVVGGLMDSPGNTARAALLPDLADRAGVRRERVNALDQSVMRMAFMLGAPLGGLLLALVGTATGLWLNACSFLVSATIIALAIPKVASHQSEARAQAANEATAGVAGDITLRESMRIGIEFLRTTPLMRALVVQVALTNMFDAMISVMYPIYARDTFGSTASLGLMLGASGAGALTTALIFGAIGHNLPRRHVYFGAFMLTSVPIVLLSLQPVLLISAGLLLIRGFGAGPLNPILMTVSQERIPINLRGRVMGVTMSIAWIAMPIGSLLGGVSVSVLGLRAALVLVGTLSFSTCLLMYLRPVFRDLERRPAPLSFATMLTPATGTASAPTHVHTHPHAPQRQFPEPAHAGRGQRQGQDYR